MNRYKTIAGSALAALLAGAGVVAAQGPDTLQTLTLPAVESMVLKRNRDIALARRAVQQAEADVITAGQKPNPQLTWLTQNINRSRGIGAGGLRDKTVDSIIGLAQTFERGDKAGLRVATAQLLTGAAGADLADSGRVALLAARAAYFDLLAAQEKLASANDTAQLFARTLDAARLRLRAGDLAGADVARGRIALALLLAAEADAGALRAVSPWPPSTIALAAPPIEEAVAARADVRAAAARVAAADRARELAQSLRTRDLTVSVQLEHYPANDANPGGSGNSVGVGVSVPLFLRHSNEGAIARAQADWYAARDILEKVKGEARAELQRARGDLEAARDRRVRIDGELLPRALQSAEAAEFAFRNGAIGVMDLLDARRTLKAIQIDASTARADFARAWAVWQANVEAAPALAAAPEAQAQTMERK